MLAQGHSKESFLSSAVFSTIILASLVIGIRWGLVGMCITYTAVVAALTPGFWWVAFRHIDLRVVDFVRSLLPVSGITFVMVLGVLGVRLLLPTTVPGAATLALQILIGAVIYVGLLVYVRPAAYVDALVAVRRSGRSRAKAPVADAPD
jgi:O-antigen/teichoic acid export membrane protein